MLDHDAGSRTQLADILPNWCHICVDMQRMFAEDTPWHVEWMDRVLPFVEEISGRFALNTIFTQFLTPVNPDHAQGTWRAYYEKWPMMTREHLPLEMLGLVSPLQKLVPPARTFGKQTYSPWPDGRLHALLRAEKVSTIVVTGGETDVCVLATILGAIDLGYRVVVLSDAVCGGADETHDAALQVLGNRFSVQLEFCKTEDFLMLV
jgi:nicotinamidase-related amidase